MALYNRQNTNTRLDLLVPLELAEFFVFVHRFNKVVEIFQIFWSMLT